MVLDTANARVYVDGRSEIIYLPREIEIVARLGTLCTELADEVQREAEPIAQRYRNPCDRNHGAGREGVEVLFL